MQGITDLITTPGLINTDFADVKMIMSNAGSALMGIGYGSGEGRALAAARSAISSPLLEASIEGARGILLNISGGSDLGLFEVNEAAEVIHGVAHPDANIIFGAVIDDEMGDEVRVTVIAAGFDRWEAGRAGAEGGDAARRGGEPPRGTRRVRRRRRRARRRRRRLRRPQLPQVTASSPDSVSRPGPTATSSTSARLPPGTTWLRQVHGATVVEVTEPGEHAGAEADAAFTTRPGCTLAVRTADCVPVVLVGDRRRRRRARGLAGPGRRRDPGHDRGPWARSSRPTSVRTSAAGATSSAADDLDEVASALGDRVRATTTWGTPALDLTAGVREALAGTPVHDAGAVHRVQRPVLLVARPRANASASPPSPGSSDGPRAMDVQSSAPTPSASATASPTRAATRLPFVSSP